MYFVEHFPLDGEIVDRTVGESEIYRAPEFLTESEWRRRQAEMATKSAASPEPSVNSNSPSDEGKGSENNSDSTLIFVVIGVVAVLACIACSGMAIVVFVVKKRRPTRRRAEFVNDSASSQSEKKKSSGVNPSHGVDDYNMGNLRVSGVDEDQQKDYMFGNVELDG